MQQYGSKTQTVEGLNQQHLSKDKKTTQRTWLPFKKKKEIILFIPDASLDLSHVYTKAYETKPKKGLPLVKF